jgi:capsular polysaccharide transport system permease protein
MSVASMRKRPPAEIEKAVIFALVMRELKTRFGNRLIGLFWVLFEPTAYIYLLLTVRSVLRAHYLGPTLEYPVYHVVAMIPYFVFRSIWFRVMDAAASNQGLFAYRQVKPFDAMIARAGLEMYVYVGVFFCVLGTLAWFGLKFFPDDPVTYIWCWVIQYFLGFGFGEFFMVLTHGRPHAKVFVRLLAMAMYLLSGILIPLAQFPPDVQYWLMLNPTANLVEIERVAYYHEYVPIPGTSMFYVLMWTIALLAAGHVLYRLNRLKLLRRT